MATRVLVVDDEQFILDLVGRALSRSGYDVATASDANQALAEVARAPGFDLLLSDIVMPGMCGPELVREIARSYPSTAVLLMSAYAPKPDFLPPYVCFIGKPFLMKDLLAMVEKALDRSRLARDEVDPASKKNTALPVESEELKRNSNKRRRAVKSSRRGTRERKRP
jgi:two-component system cell cycle sensor histidine kinase/response regulator CckA